MCPVWQPCLNGTVCVNTEHDMSCSNFKEPNIQLHRRASYLSNIFLE